MRILVLGASQGTGALAVKAALDRGHKVTAFARHPDKLVLENADLARVSGDFHNQESVAKVMPGHEAVIWDFGTARDPPFPRPRLAPPTIAS